MSRQAKRAQDRELKKDIKAVGSLTPRQEQMMERKAINISNRYIEEYGMLIDRSLTAALVDYGIMYGDIEIINRNMSELLLEDSKKTHILEGENLDMVAIQKEVQEAIEKLLEDGTEKKKTINILIYKFPKLSKSMLLTAYGKIRRDLGLTENRLSPKLVNDEFKLKSEKLNGKEMVEHIMDKFDFTKSTAETYYYKWKREFMADKESTVAKGPSLEQIPVVIKTPTPKETEKILETLIEEKKIKTSEHRNSYNTNKKTSGGSWDERIKSIRGKDN